VTASPYGKYTCVVKMAGRDHHKVTSARYIDHAASSMFRALTASTTRRRDNLERHQSEWTALERRTTPLLEPMKSRSALYAPEEFPAIFMRLISVS